MKVVNDIFKAIIASIITILLVTPVTATAYERVEEYTVTIYQLAWRNNRFEIYTSGSFQVYSWDFTDMHKEIERTPLQNTTVLRHVTIEYWGLDYFTGACTVYRTEEFKEKVDWPINVIFVGPKVTKTFVFDFLKSIAGILSCVECGSIMYMYLRNYNTSWQWDSARGFKHWLWNVASLIGWSYSCSGVSGFYVLLHVRLYAPAQPNGEKYFTDGNSRYVVASAHFDRNEGFPDANSGWSECAEKFLADLVEGRAGSAGYKVEVKRSYVYAYNRIDYTRVVDGMIYKVAIGLHSITIRKSLDDYCRYLEGKFDKLYHVYLNNGYATYIFIDR